MRKSQAQTFPVADNRAISRKISCTRAPRIATTAQEVAESAGLQDGGSLSADATGLRRPTWINFRVAFALR